jgi:hypothetical protein
MQRPLTNQGPYTLTNRIGANEQETPANHVSVDLSLSLSTNHMRAFSVTGDAETGFKAPGSKRSKLEYDGLLSSFAFNFNLRRYTKNPEDYPDAAGQPHVQVALRLRAAGKREVRRCRLTL